MAPPSFQAMEPPVIPGRFTQVLQEFYVVATRKFDPPLSKRAARRIVGTYAEWSVVHIDVPMLLAASQLEQRHRVSFWDALIVEAARRAGASRLVSEDFQAGRRLAGLVIENPFAQTHDRPSPDRPS